MSKYYCLIAGLPAVTPDDAKMAYSVAEFKAEAEPQLSDADRNLLRLYFMKYDNANLLAMLGKADKPFDGRGNMSQEAMAEFCEAVQNEDVAGGGRSAPPYFAKFAHEYASREKDVSDASPVSPEDRLATLYFDYAMGCGNGFMSSWFELNLNIGNLLAAINCQKYGWDKSGYIVGSSETAEQIRTSSARDFGLGDSLDYFAELQRIAEEKDLMMREKRIDLLKWSWLDEHTFFKTFDFESVFAYLLRLEMIERWIKLDRGLGEKTFRELVGAMKRESSEALNEFKKNNR